MWEEAEGYSQPKVADSAGSSEDVLPGEVPAAPKAMPGRKWRKAKAAPAAGDVPAAGEDPSPEEAEAAAGDAPAAEEPEGVAVEAPAAEQAEGAAGEAPAAEEPASNPEVLQRKPREPSFSFRLVFFNCWQEGLYIKMAPWPLPIKLVSVA